MSTPLPGIKLFDLTNRVAIITGGSKGLGLAMAAGLASAGARIVIANRNPEEGEAAAASINQEYGVDVIAYNGDVTSLEDMEEMASAAMDTFGRIDILINSAGINIRGPIDELTIEDFYKVMDINVLGVVNMIRAVTKPMADHGGGRIVVVSSTAGHGYDSFAGVPYTASKWAVHGLLFTARQQLNALGIVLSEYAPGEANTPIVDKRPVQPSPEHRGAMIQTDDCGDTIFFMASQPHGMSVIQLPVYQPFGGMPPQVATPWLDDLGLK